MKLHCSSLVSALLLILPLLLPLSAQEFFGGALRPNLHLDAAASSLDGAEYEDLLRGAHDPGDDLVVQGLEPSLSLRTDHVHGYLNWLFAYDGDEWTDENEEAFLKFVNIPGLPADTHVRAGRMLSRFGQLNNKHIHGGDWRDTPFVVTSFLGDEGLNMEGGELTVPLSFGNRTALTIGFGKAREHDHGHGDEEDHHDDEDHHDEDEDHHDEEEGHHDDEEEHHDEEEGHHDEEDEHGHDDEHGHEEALAFAEDLLTARLVSEWGPSDFHRFESGISTALGEDEDGGDLNVHGIDFTYTWRENGLEAGGRQLRWTTEFMLRDPDEGDTQYGGYSSALYSFNDQIDAGLRVGVLDAADDDEETAFRISPLVAYHPTPLTSVRLQGNYMELPNGEDAQSVILGLSMALFPSTEVR